MTPQQTAEAMARKCAGVLGKPCPPEVILSVIPLVQLIEVAKAVDDYMKPCEYSLEPIETALTNLKKAWPEL